MAPALVGGWRRGRQPSSNRHRWALPYRACGYAGAVLTKMNRTARSVSGSICDAGCVTLIVLCAGRCSANFVFGFYLAEVVLVDRVVDRQTVRLIGTDASTEPRDRPDASRDRATWAVHLLAFDEQRARLVQRPVSSR